MVISVLLGGGFRVLLFVWHFSFSSKKLFSGNTKRLPASVQLGGAGAELGGVDGTSPAVNPGLFACSACSEAMRSCTLLFREGSKGRKK